MSHPWGKPDYSCGLFGSYCSENRRCAILIMSGWKIKSGTLRLLPILPQSMRRKAGRSSILSKSRRNLINLWRSTGFKAPKPLTRLRVSARRIQGLNSFYATRPLRVHATRKKLPVIAMPSILFARTTNISPLRQIISYNYTKFCTAIPEKVSAAN